MGGAAEVVAAAGVVAGAEAAGAVGVLEHPVMIDKDAKTSTRHRLNNHNDNLLIFTFSSLLKLVTWSY